MPVPGVPADVPFVGDLAGNDADRALLDMLLAPDALGRPYVISRKVPVDRLAALRAAFDATMEDPKFLADAQRLELPVAGPISGLPEQALVESSYRTSPELVARARAIIAK